MDDVYVSELVSTVNFMPLHRGLQSIYTMLRLQIKYSSCSL